MSSGKIKSETSTVLSRTKSSAHGWRLSLNKTGSSRLRLRRAAKRISSHANQEKIEAFLTVIKNLHKKN